MESSKLKIFFFCYGNVYMLRGEREGAKLREEKQGGRRERYHHVSPRGKGRGRKEGAKNDSVWI